MNGHSIAVIYRKELREWLRDRRTLISSVVIPLLAVPILMVGISAVAINMVKQAEKEKPKVMIIGGTDSPEVLAGLMKLDSIDVVPTATDWKDQIINKTIRAVVAVPEGFQEALARGEGRIVIISYYNGELKSEFGVQKLDDYFKKYREQVVSARLAAKNLPVTILKPFDVKKENVAPPEKVGGATFGGFIGYSVILLCMTGAIYPAIDLTAGEKERGTMETILTSSVSRMDIVLGKFLLVLSASLTSAALSVVSMGTSFTILGKYKAFSGGGAELQLHIGWKAVAAIFLIALPLAVVFSAVLMTIALFAKSYKEAQSYLTPMTFLVVIPAVASVLPGIELTPKLAIIPILNASLLCKEIVSGTYHWNYIALIFLSTCVYAAAALFLATKMFQREDVLFRS